MSALSAAWQRITEPQDARRLGLFRIALGAALLYDVCDRLADFHAFYTERGLVPRALSFAGRDPFAWSLFDMSTETSFAVFLYASGLVSLACFTVGYRSRLANFASLVFMISLHNRNYLVSDGADSIERCALFWCLCADSGARLSVDALLDGARVDVPWWGLALLRAQVVVIYAYATVAKVRGGWLHGEPLYHALQLRDHAHWLAPVLLRHPTLVHVMGIGTVGAEAALALLLVLPERWTRLRWLGFVLMVGLHVAIYACLSVSMFTGLMLALSVLFAPPPLLDAVWRFFRRWMTVVHARSDDRRRLPLGAAVGVAQMLVVLWLTSHLALGRATPAWMRHEAEVAGVMQGWDMFDHAVESQATWRAPATFSDGHVEDLIPLVAPKLAWRGPRGRFSRWYRLPLSYLSSTDDAPFRALGLYLCRRYTALGRAPALDRVAIVYDKEIIVDPGRPTPPTESRTLIEMSCHEKKTADTTQELVRN